MADQYRDYDREYDYAARTYDRDYEDSGRFSRSDEYEPSYGLSDDVSGTRYDREVQDRRRIGRDDEFEPGYGIGYNYGRGQYYGQAMRGFGGYGPETSREYNYGPRQAAYRRGYRTGYAGGYPYPYGNRDDHDASGHFVPTSSHYQSDRWTRGPFTGIGPRGYVRSDERIREDVNHRLTQHGQIDATDIQVDVSNREVTLRGTVDNRHQKRLAEAVTESVSGVADVHNELRVTAQHPGRRGIMTVHGPIRPDMPVVGRDGEQIGRIKEIRRRGFLVERALGRDVFVPIRAIQMVSGDRVALAVDAGEV